MNNQLNKSEKKVDRILGFSENKETSTSSIVSNVEKTRIEQNSEGIVISVQQ